MPQPPAYNRSKDFTDDFGDETDHSALNAELDSSANSINDIRTNLAILQADDGALRPSVVTPDSISDELRTDLVNSAAEGIADSAALANSRAQEAQEAATLAGSHATNAGTSAGAAEAAKTAAQAAAASVDAGNIVHRTTDESIDGIKTFSASPIVPSLSVGEDSQKAAPASLVKAAIAALGLPALVGKALNYLRVKSDESGYELRTAIQTRSDLGLAAVASSGSASDLSTGTLPAARLPAATTSAVGGVQLATDTEARALSDTSKPITPSTLKTAMTGSNQSLGASGYQKFPGGHIEQWGKISGASGSGTVVFPTAFPTDCDNVQLSNNTSGNTPVWQTISAASFTYVAPTTMDIFWRAIGR